MKAEIEIATDMVRCILGSSYISQLSGQEEKNEVMSKSSAGLTGEGRVVLPLGDLQLLARETQNDHFNKEHLLSHKTESFEEEQLPSRMI